MLKKRGQVTIFVIIAILIVAGIVLFSYVQNKNSSLTPSIPKDVQPIYNYLKDCFEKEVYASIYEIGQFGGYVSPPNDSLDIGIPIYLNKYKKEIPSLEFIEIQTSELIKENIQKCNFNFTGFGIKKDNPKILTSILNNQVKINIEYSLTVSKEESSYMLKNFPEVNIPIKFGLMYNAALEIIRIQEKNSESICLSCLSELEEEYNFDINALEYEEGVIIYGISDTQEINNLTYEFNFAIK